MQLHIVKKIFCVKTWASSLLGCTRHFSKNYLINRLVGTGNVVINDYFYVSTWASGSRVGTSDHARGWGRGYTCKRQEHYYSSKQRMLKI